MKEVFALIGCETAEPNLCAVMTEKNAMRFQTS